MAEQQHDRGTMDIEDQERTFEGFIKAVTWVGIAIVIFLVFLGLVNA